MHIRNKELNYQIESKEITEALLYMTHNFSGLDSLIHTNIHRNFLFLI